MAHHYLILEKAAAKRPNTAEDKVQFLPLLWTFGRGVDGSEHALQQKAQHLQMSDVSNRCYLLKAGLCDIETKRDVLVEENRQVSSLRLDLAPVDPTANKSLKNDRPIN